jgi:group I intron endonuclease
MEEKTFLIYKHTAPNGKAYIGQTCDLHRRNIVHKNTTGCRAFANAIKKYGWEAFEHEVLREGLTLDEANQIEQELIATHNTMSPNGYNLVSGGKNGIPSEESIERMASKRRGRKLSDDHRARLSELGKAMPRERIEKMVEAAREARKHQTGPHFNQGRKRSEDFKKKVSLATKAALSDPDIRKKISDSQIGGKHSEETKAKQSEAAKQRWASAKEAGTNKWSEKARENHMAARANGATEETRKRISENSKRMWEKRRAAGLCEVSEDEIAARKKKRNAHRAAWAREDRLRKKEAAKAASSEKSPG